MTIKTQGGKVVTKDGKVSCECCDFCTPPFPTNPTSGAEITKQQYRAMLKGGSFYHRQSAVFSDTTECENGTFETTVEFDEFLPVASSQSEVSCIKTFINGPTICFFWIWSFERKYYFQFLTSFISIPFLYVRGGFNSGTTNANVPYDYVPTFSGNVKINDEGITGNWQIVGCSQGSGITVSVTQEISITTNDP